MCRKSEASAGDIALFAEAFKLVFSSLLRGKDPMQELKDRQEQSGKDFEAQLSLTENGRELQRLMAEQRRAAGNQYSWEKTDA